MKFSGFAIITILPSVLATLRSIFPPSGYTRIELPEKWVSGPVPREFFDQPEWSEKSYIDFTGDIASRLASVTIGEEYSDFHLRVSKHLREGKVFLTNNSSQKQTYLLVDPVGDRWLLNDIEPKEKHIARAKELQVYVKPPGSEDPNAQPQKCEDAVYEGPNEGHDSEDEGHDYENEGHGSQDKGHDFQDKGHDSHDKVHGSQNEHPSYALPVEKLSQTGHKPGSHVGGNLSEDKESALRN